MKLTLFNTFVKAVENQNLSRTAEELNLSQPAVSKQIQALEDLYGVLLLERSGRKLKTTEAGEALYTCAREILAVIEKTDRIMEDISASRRGKLFVGASTIPGQYILPPIFKEFKDEYPNVNISMRIADTDRIYSKVAERELDLGVVGAWLGSRKVDGFKWVEDELVVLVPSHHPLAKEPRVKLSRLTSESWIFREKGSGTRMATESLLSSFGINKNDLNIQIEVGSTAATIAAVQADLGIAMVSKFVAAKLTGSENLTAISIEDGIAKRDIYVIYPRQKHRRKTVDNFIYFLKNHKQ